MAPAGGGIYPKLPLLGYKRHLLVDILYEIPIGFDLTPANEADTTHFEPLLKERDRLLPEVGLKAGIADAGYDSKANCLAVRNRGGVPIMPLKLGGEKAPPGITNAQGTPLCPIGLPMVYWGRDGHYLWLRPTWCDGPTLFMPREDAVSDTFRL